MPGYLTKEDSIREQVELGKKKLLRNRFRKYLAYYQQGTCTVAPVSELLAQTAFLLQDEDCVGVIFSTRPDYVSEEFLAPLSVLIRERGKECHFELGLQSAHEKGLVLMNRNHTVRDFEESVSKLKQYDVFSIGAHLIFGIPGEIRKDMVESARHVCGLGLDSLKIHHLQVLQNTVLHEMYLQGGITLFKREEYLDLLLEVLPMVPAEIFIHRLWAHSHPDLLAAPKWDILPAELSRQLHEKMQQSGIRQGCNC